MTTAATGKDRNLLALCGITTRKAFKAHCMKASYQQPIQKDIYGAVMGELYSKAVKAIADQMVADGYPRSEQFAQEVLFRLSDLRVDGWKVGTCDVLSLAIREPELVVAEVGAELLAGNIPPLEPAKPNALDRIRNLFNN